MNELPDLISFDGVGGDAKVEDDKNVNVEGEGEGEGEEEGEGEDGTIKRPIINNTIHGSALPDGLLELQNEFIELQKSTMAAKVAHTDQMVHLNRQIVELQHNIERLSLTLKAFFGNSNRINNPLIV